VNNPHPNQTGWLFCFVLALNLAAGPVLAAEQQGAAPVHPLPANEVHGILGEEVYGPDGRALGRLIDVLVDANGVPRAAVIDFGGFLGVGNRKIAVAWKNLHFQPKAAQVIICDLSPDEIKDAPEYRGGSAAVVSKSQATTSPPKGTSPGQTGANSAPR